VPEQVLDLGRQVEAEPRELGVERARDRERVAGPVEEVRIANVMWVAPAATSCRISARQISRGTDEEAPP